MKVHNDHWSEQQYIDLIASIRPGVTLKRLVIATKSTTESVLFKLKGLNILLDAEPRYVAPGSTGYRWVKGTRFNKLIVRDLERGTRISLIDHAIACGWKQDGNKLLNPAFESNPYINQLMEGNLSESQRQYSVKKKHFCY